MATSLSHHIINYQKKYTKAAPLAVFRLLYGLIMFVSMIRFWYHGWIEKLYLEPVMHFKYDWFRYIEVPGNFTYVIFIVCALSAFCLAIGYKYRLSVLTFLLSFGFIELMDKTTYLNHYYLISIMAFILLFLPAHCYFSVDAHRNPELKSNMIPRWQIDVLKLMLAIVYLYAGLAKLNADWMLKAMPLTLWLPTKSDIPFIGSLMQEKWMHYAFSWGGALYDIFIVGLLLWKQTRWFAFFLVLAFHIMTRVLFPIGMFPYIMIASTLIFFDGELHEAIIKRINSFFKLPYQFLTSLKSYAPQSKLSFYVLGVFMIFQLLIPWRYVLYQENMFWTERCYRYSWRVMLMEKTGYANFKIVDDKTKKRFYVQNQDFLTPLQEKEMSTQPDFILEYGQYLGRHFESQGHQNVTVYVENYASLNGRRSQEFVSSKVDLMSIDYRTLMDKYITPLHE